MGLIKEPIDVDFLVDSRPLTRKEQETISDFIKLDKEKNAKKIRKSLKPKLEVKDLQMA